MACSLGAPQEALDGALAQLSVLAGPPRLLRPVSVRKLIRRPTRTRKPVAVVAKPEVRPSAWDPPSATDHIEADIYRALLLDTIRRAAHDWVLYRTHAKMEMKELASHARIWLFEEQPGHLWWGYRQRSGKMITAFLVICEQLDLDPGYVRRKIKTMKPEQILKAGRPPERRRRRRSDEASMVSHSLVDTVEIGSLETGMTGDYVSDYEVRYAVETPRYL